MRLAIRNQDGWRPAMSHSVASPTSSFFFVGGNVINGRQCESSLDRVSVQSLSLRDEFFYGNAFHEARVAAPSPTRPALS